MNTGAVFRDMAGNKINIHGIGDEYGYTRAQMPYTISSSMKTARMISKPSILSGMKIRKY